MNNDNGLTYVPKFVRQTSDLGYGDIVTHENYNEKLNLLIQQGDYNTEVLRQLLTPEYDPERTYHIYYLDKALEDEATRVDQNLQDAVDTLNGRIDDITEGIDDRFTADERDIATNARNIETNADNIATNTLNIATNAADILKILDGTTPVAKADAITGIENAGARKYYGTDRTSAAGFYDMPAAIFAEGTEAQPALVNGIIFTPAPDSVEESMLTSDVRTKLNRTNITDYELLDNLPLINNVQLKGNKSLADLGIQPAGSYISPAAVADSYYNKTEVDNLLNPKLDTSTAASTYQTQAGMSSYLTTAAASSTYDTITSVDNKISTVNSSITSLGNDRAKVFVQSGTPSGAKTGDLWIAV